MTGYCFRVLKMNKKAKNVENIAKKEYIYKVLSLKKKLIFDKIDYICF